MKKDGMPTLSSQQKKITLSYGVKEKREILTNKNDAPHSVVVSRVARLTELGCDLRLAQDRDSMHGNG